MVAKWMLRLSKLRLLPLHQRHERCFMSSVQNGCRLRISAERRLFKSSGANISTAQSLFKGKPSTCLFGKCFHSNKFDDARPARNTVDKLTDLLLENIIFENEHVLAINKPSGLSLHIKRDGGLGDESVGVSDAIPLMKQRLNVKYLDTAVGINRHYSGIILMAKSIEIFQKLRKFYTSSVPAQKVLPYTFWGLTVRVPQPLHGDDKFIITRKEIGDHLLTYMEHNPSNRRQERGEYLRPFIKYEVLDRTHSTNCALVEFQPTTSKWDVLPLYIVTKLAPLLGDHIYSPRLKSVLGHVVFQDQYAAVPESQNLSKLVARRLQVEFNKTHEIPLHLHHKKLMVPKLSRKVQSMNIEVPLPDFFIESMKKLGLKHVRDDSKSTGESHEKQELLGVLPNARDNSKEPISSSDR